MGDNDLKAVEDAHEGLQSLLVEQHRQAFQSKSSSVFSENRPSRSNSSATSRAGGSNPTSRK